MFEAKARDRDGTAWNNSQDLACLKLGGNTKFFFGFSLRLTQGNKIYEGSVSTDRPPPSAEKVTLSMFHLIPSLSHRTKKLL